eukprot:PhM_4_TR10165/c0_g1_i1/m.55504
MKYAYRPSFRNIITVLLMLLSVLLISRKTSALMRQTTKPRTAVESATQPPAHTIEVTAEASYTTIPNPLIQENANQPSKAPPKRNVPPAPCTTLDVGAGEWVGADYVEEQCARRTVADVVAHPPAALTNSSVLFVGDDRLKDVFLSLVSMFAAVPTDRTGVVEFWSPTLRTTFMFMSAQFTLHPSAVSRRLRRGDVRHLVINFGFHHIMYMDSTHDEFVSRLTRELWSTAQSFTNVTSVTFLSLPTFHPIGASVKLAHKLTQRCGTNMRRDDYNRRLMCSINNTNEALAGLGRLNGYDSNGTTTQSNAQNLNRDGTRGGARRIVFLNIAVMTMSAARFTSGGGTSYRGTPVPRGIAGVWIESLYPHAPTVFDRNSTNSTFSSPGNGTEALPSSNGQRVTMVHDVQPLVGCAAYPWSRRDVMCQCESGTKHRMPNCERRNRLLRHFHRIENS